MPPLLLILALYLGLQLPLPATEVLTYRYNQYGNGANTNEKSLNLDTVNPWDFGLRFTVPVPGQVYAQPLYKSGVGGKNLAFVATEHPIAHQRFKNPPIIMTGIPERATARRNVATTSTRRAPNLSVGHPPI